MYIDYVCDLHVNLRTVLYQLFFSNLFGEKTRQSSRGDLRVARQLWIAKCIVFCWLPAYDKTEKIESAKQFWVMLLLNCLYYSKIFVIFMLFLNPFSPNKDKYQFPPNMFNTWSRKGLWEFLKWSPKEKLFDLFSNSLNEFFNKMCVDQFGEFLSG